MERMRLNALKKKLALEK